MATTRWPLISAGISNIGPTFSAPVTTRLPSAAMVSSTGAGRSRGASTAGTVSGSSSQSRIL